MTEHGPLFDHSTIVQTVRAAGPEVQYVVTETLIVLLTGTRYPDAHFPETLREKVERLSSREPLLAQVLEPLHQLATGPENRLVLAQIYDGILIPPAR